MDLNPGRRESTARRASKHCGLISGLTHGGPAMNALQLCRWQFLHMKTLQQTFFKRSATLDEKRPFCFSEPPLET